MNTLDFKHGYSLPDFVIDYQDQQLLINTAKQLLLEGRIQTSAYHTKEYSGPNFVFGLPFRGMYRDGVQLSRSLGNRFNTELEWLWDDTMPSKALEVMKKIVTPIQELCYKTLTRCSVLVQVENIDLPLHTDGYESLKVFHDMNKNLCIKIPLTELQLDNGCPILEIDQKVYEYKTGNTAFLLDDMTIKHGSKGVDHARGVIILDGILDWDKIDTLAKAPIRLNELTVPLSL